jgi:O-antigen ligase
MPAGRPAVTRTATLVSAVLVGTIAAALAVELNNLTWKGILLGLLVAAVVPLAALTRLPKTILLMAWVLSLTYFRVSFPIPSMGGFQGFYVTIADAVFLLVLGYWFYEAVICRRPIVAHGPPLLWYFLPFAMVCLISALLAERSDWALYEVVRVAKVLLILLYCRYNIGRTEWWTCVCALGLAVVAQATLGVLQLEGLLGHYQNEIWDPVLRPNGTLAHASIFSGYMLLVAPLMLALAVTLHRNWLRLLFGLAGLMGYIGVALSLSRVPWLLAMLEASGLTIGFLKLRMVRLHRAIAVSSIILAAIGLALIPFLGQIQSRLTTGLDEAIVWRIQMDDIGIDVFEGHPFLGIGLANFPLYLRSTNMEFADSLDLAMSGVLARAGSDAPIVEGFHWVWVPHNLYLLLLAETGALGLGSFLLYLFTAVRIGIRALRLLDGYWRGAALGMLIGMFGILLHMMTDWALWLDPILFTFALLVGLLNNAPTVAGIGEPGESILRLN